MNGQTTSAAPGRFGLRHILVMVAGAAVGLSIWTRGKDVDNPAGLALGIFGGIALAGPPMLLADRFRRRNAERIRRWGAGRILWFSQGTAAWLLWPPVAVLRWRGNEKMGGSTTGTCFAYGTPLMALFMVAALLAGGWIRPGRRRRRRPLDWRDRLGLILGLGWASVGLWLLGTFWKEDLGL